MSGCGCPMLSKAIAVLFVLAAGPALADARQDCWRMEGDAKIAACTQAIAKSPRDSELYELRALAYQWREDYEKALADFNKAIEINPKSAVAFNGRGDIARAVDNFDQAIANYSRAIELNPRHWLAYAYRGLSHWD